MKTILIVCTAVVTFIAGSQAAHATVGGPKYVYDLKYNPTDSSMYYTEQSYSGRGCPPELKKISLTNPQSSTVLSCDHLQSLSMNDVNSEIYGITENFKSLTQINLVKNNIRIDLAYVKEEKIPNDEMVIKSYFNADIYQDNVHIGSFPIEGCDIEQPFLMAGYAVPGLNKKIIFLTSAKGDCWEGGYVYETLDAANVTIKDRSEISNSFKMNSPLTPNEGTILVYEQSQVSGKPAENGEDKYNDTTLIIIAVTFLIIGIGTGFLVKRK
jgi:hypothetical protein